MIKLVINLVASVILLLYMQTLGGLADAASENLAAPGRLDDLRSPSPVVHAGAALLLLVVAAVLAVYKPRGQTAYGWRRTRGTP